MPRFEMHNCSIREMYDCFQLVASVFGFTVHTLLKFQWCAERMGRIPTGTLRANPTRRGKLGRKARHGEMLCGCKGQILDATASSQVNRSVHLATMSVFPRLYCHFLYASQASGRSYVRNSIGIRCLSHEE